MTPGVIRYDEASAGQINHALRIVVGCTSGTWIRPAEHAAKHPLCKQPDSAYPPFGLRFRLRLDFNISAQLFKHPANRAILRALQQYGAIVCVNHAYVL